MDLIPNSDEQQIIDASRKFLAEQWPVSRLHRPGADRFNLADRQGFSELGWFGLGVAEDAGGVGFSSIEGALLYREMGRHLAPVGVLPIALAASLCSLENIPLGNELVQGNHGVALAIAESPLNLTDSELSGTFRLFSHSDARFGLAVDDSQCLLFELQNSQITFLPCLDKSVTMARAHIHSAPLRALDHSTTISSTGRLYSAAMLLGIAEAVTDMIVDYAKIRETFGRPIGAYQAVRHPCADMAVRNEAARAQLFYASVALRDRRLDADLQVDAAKHLCNEAALANVDANIQLHGGIATTDEHDAHHYMKRAHILSRWFGGNKLTLNRILHAAVAS